MIDDIPPPPSLDDYRAGQQLIAGPGVATVLPDLDLETYSEAGFFWDEEKQTWRGPRGASGKRGKGLPAVGARVYAEHASTEVLSLYYDLKDGEGRKHWAPGKGLPARLVMHVLQGGLIEAHNSAFEAQMWEFCMVPKYGFPPMAPEQWRCSASKARAYQLPGSLGPLGEVLKIENAKDKEGDRLIKLFSMPQKPTKARPGKRVYMRDEPVDGPKFIAYNERDIVAEAEVSSLVPDLSPLELRYWQCDQAINRRGVPIDAESLFACRNIVEQCHEVYNAELRVLTNGAVEKASQLQRLKAWLETFGLHIGAMDEESIDDFLDSYSDSTDANQLPEAARRALELRQLIGSASVKKVYAMCNQLASDGRLHDLFNFHATRTGRPTGDGPQPTNMPKAGPECYQCECWRWHAAPLCCPWCGELRGPEEAHEWNVAATEDALEVIRLGSMELVEAFFGDAMLTVSGCLRSLFCAPPGREFVSSDYTAIEAVVAAALANEEWRLEVFRTHGKIYEASAAQSFKVPLQEILDYKVQTGKHHHLRAKGKISELALGFGGWINSAKMFGHPGTDEEIKQEILAWRDASPAIVELWGGQFRGRGWNKQPELYGIEGAAILAIQLPGTEQPVMRRDGTPSGISYFTTGNGKTLHCRLLSGRLITYHNVVCQASRDAWRGLELSFEGWNTNPKNGPPQKWIRMRTWGSRLFENVVQATANDILRHATIHLEERGYPVVLHVYDEIVSEVPEGEGASVAELENIMTDLPLWALDWPIKADGGWKGRRYRKG